MQMQMAGHAVDVDGGQLGLDEGAGIVMECFGHMHAVRADPVIRHALFQVGNLLHIYHLGFGAVRHIRNAADGSHLTAFAAVSSFRRSTPHLVCPGEVGAAGRSGGLALVG